MKLYIWIDENGAWRVTDYMPDEDTPAVEVVLDEYATLPTFFDADYLHQISVETKT